MKKFIATAAIAASIVGVGSAVASAGTPEQNTQAMQEFSATVGVGTTAGAVVGGLTGAIVGCIGGGVVTAPTVVFVPLGCVTGAAAGIPIGTALGTVIIGGPTALVAGVRMVQVLILPAQ